MGIGGVPVVNIADWKANTLYEGTASTNPLVRWFWTLVSSWDADQRAKLLLFVTGSSTVPVGGFKHLQGQPGDLRPFTIKQVPLGPGTGKFPKGHTCFNRLDLPAYSCQQDL